jgi:hypothetical protein
MEFDIPKMYRYHKQNSVNIEVDVWRISGLEVTCFLVDMSHLFWRFILSSLQTLSMEDRRRIESENMISQQEGVKEKSAKNRSRRDNNSARGGRGKGRRTKIEQRKVRK